jgi:hypothetical protein
MNNKQIPAHIIFTIVYLSLALVTAVPTGTASKISLLGYNALCSFTPISTIILLALGSLHLYSYKRNTAVRSTE